MLVDEDVIVEAENTEKKRSNGFSRIVKSPSRQNVSKVRQKLPNLAAAARNGTPEKSLKRNH